MSNRTHAQLQSWYRQFAREVFAKANIKVDCIVDLGRIKNFHITQWDEDEPLEPKGEFCYAYVPHDGLTYDSPPP